MILFPAIDLYDGKAVRLLHGDYENITVYSDDPVSVACRMRELGAGYLHLVDLAGARDGGTPHLELVRRIAEASGLFTELGGGVRSLETAERYLNAGVSRVILGTAAITDPDFLSAAVAAFGDRVTVGADVRDGKIAIRGWLETAQESLDEFLARMQSLGVQTVICTDISRDGAMRGTNLALYRTLSRKYRMNLTASGGVSTLDDLRALRAMGLYGAILGKAYYTGAVDLREALEVCR